MSHTVPPHAADPASLRSPGSAGAFVGAVLAGWLLLVLVLGTRGAFVSPPGTPPLPIALAALSPLGIFFTAYRASGAFRDFVLAADVRIMTAMQAWRFGGLGFLALYAWGVLPAVFAFPAGLGDMTIAVAAPWMLWRFATQPRFASSRAFMTWNVLGVLDLVLAVTIGTTASLLATGAAGEVSTAPMAQLPLVLIPAYLVPLFIMLHAAALFQARRFGRTAGGRSVPRAGES